jgi:hypothetical protein
MQTEPDRKVSRPCSDSQGRNTLKHEVLRTLLAVTGKITVFWDVTPFGLVTNVSEEPVASNFSVQGLHLQGKCKKGTVVPVN